jgi:hypothetical protein
MNRIFTLISIALVSSAFGQEEGDPDTTRMNFGNTEIIIVEKGGDKSDVDIEVGEDFDSLDSKKDKPQKEAHWAGVNFGFSMLMDAGLDNTFPNHPYWKNDPARSQSWDLNVFEYKFNIAKHYVGLTTGIGFNFASVAFRDNYLISETSDTLIANIDTINTYSKNKLKATYLTVPLMLEFNTNAKASKSFYLAAGVIGGVRLTSKVKRTGEFDGKEFKQKDKGVYGLNSFKLDAAVRLGYSDWGVYANYSLLPLFNTDKTIEIYPLTFGLSYNF